MATNPGKRPLDVDGEDSDAKRIRSNNGSPAPAKGMSETERKKAEAKAKMDAIKAKLAAQKAASSAGSASTSSRVPAATKPVAGANGLDLEAKKAEAQRRMMEVKAKLAARQAEQARAAGPSSSGAQSEAKPKMSDKDIRIAEARERAKQRAAEIAARMSQKDAPPSAPGQGVEGLSSGRGGLHIGLHPSLLADKAGAAQGDEAKGGRRPKDPAVNQYLVASDTRVPDEIYDSSLITRKGGERKSKSLVFNQKGKFMAQANALRQQAKIEEMKARIAAQTRKTEIEEASDKSFLIPVPPEMEWWDEGIVNKIDTPDSIITALIQHPVILQPPQDKFQPAPKPLMLTPKEQAKLRRQRRRENLKEEQAKIRLGLIEPPPPKVKKSNMMTVYGEQAVQDPTAVEARVNREIAKRASDHVKANAERALTDEQRKEKLKRQQEGDEAKGIQVAVFRVDNLSSGKHRYKIDVNAKQHALTGIVILHPEMNLVIVEGGHHSMKEYKKLMLNRIDWSENPLPIQGASRPTTFTGANDGTKVTGEQNKAAQWLSPTDEEGNLKDLSENRCQLVWEGEEGQRSFKRWGSKACETDGEARDILSRNKMENMWTRARSLH